MCMHFMLHVQPWDCSDQHMQVSEVPAGSGDIRDGEGEREGEREGEVGELQIEAEVSETDTTQLLGNNHNLT